MLNVFSLMLAILPLGAEPAMPTTTPAAIAPQTLATASALDARVDAALEAAKKAILAGKMDRTAYAELIAAIRAAYADLTVATPSADTIRARLQAAIDDIYARAAKAAIKAPEFEKLRIASIEARLAAAVKNVMADPTVDNLRKIVEQLNSLADAAKTLDPDIATVRARAQAMVDALVKKARFTSADVDALRVELSAASAVRWTTILSTSGTTLDCYAADWNRARSSISDHFVSVATDDPATKDVLANLLKAIDTLEQRFTAAAAAGAPLSRADFNDLITQLVARARKAA